MSNHNTASLNKTPDSRFINYHSFLAQDFYLRNSRGNPKEDLKQWRVPVIGSKVMKSGHSFKICSSHCSKSAVRLCLKNHPAFVLQMETDWDSHEFSSWALMLAIWWVNRSAGWAFTRDMSWLIWATGWENLVFIKIMSKEVVITHLKCLRATEGAYGCCQQISRTYCCCHLVDRNMNHRIKRNSFNKLNLQLTFFPFLKYRREI